MVFVEAKPSGTKFAEDGSEVAQAIQYASAKVVDWAVLTDGAQWWLYDAFAKVPHPRKRILGIDLLGKTEGADPPELIELLTPDAVTSGRLQAFSRRARWYEAVRSLLQEAPDDLIQMVAKRGKLEADPALAKEVLAEFGTACCRPRP